MINNSSTLKTQQELSTLPCYTKAEELMNSLTHGLGIIFSIIAGHILIKKYSGDFRSVIFAGIYVLTLFVLYSASTLYHSLKPGKAKFILRKMDHCSIFLLIAGTYTPLCTLCIKDFSALAVLGAVWICALVGIILNSISVNRFSKFSLACYIAMGWSVVFIVKPAMQGLNSIQMKYLLIGGIFYTVGAVLYVLGKKKKYMHSIWHLFVLAGSIYHFLILC